MKQTKEYISNGKWKEALSIARKFRLGFSKEEQDKICIAFESLSGHNEFYRSLGIDTDKCLIEAVEILSSKYNVKKM